MFLTEARCDMVDDIPHDEGSPRREEEPEHVPLPPRVRPFDPATYHPEVHVLPLSTVCHFIGFTWCAPADLLLREPVSHMSHDAPEVNSRFTHEYVSTVAREWYLEFPDGVQQIINKVGFGLFCSGLSRLYVSRTVLGTLVERWWDTTNSFYFSTAGDMTMTPYDFVMLTGLEVGGQPIPYDSNMGEWERGLDSSTGSTPTHLPIIGLGPVYLIRRPFQRERAYDS
ncbi:hypothetical protein ACSBR1_027235 [Camellia fascicularis]